VKTSEKIVLVVAIAVAGVVLWAELGRRKPTGLSVDAGVSAGFSDDVQKPWLCQPSDMHHVMTRRHPLYRRPDGSRPAHRKLCAAGWREWYRELPSEQL